MCKLKSLMPNIHIQHFKYYLWQVKNINCRIQDKSPMDKTSTAYCKCLLPILYSCTLKLICAFFLFCNSSQQRATPAMPTTRLEMLTYVDMKFDITARRKMHIDDGTMPDEQNINDTKIN